MTHSGVPRHRFVTRCESSRRPVYASTITGERTVTKGGSRGRSQWLVDIYVRLVGVPRPYLPPKEVRGQDGNVETPESLRVGHKTHVGWSGSSIYSGSLYTRGLSEGL